MKGRFDGKFEKDGKTPRPESVCYECDSHVQPIFEHRGRPICIFCYNGIPESIDLRRGDFVRAANILRKDLGRLESKMDNIIGLLTYRAGKTSSEEVPS